MADLHHLIGKALFDCQKNDPPETMNNPNIEPNRSWLKPTSFVLFVAVCLPLIATATVSGKSSVEKMLTGMVQPLFVAIVAALAVGVVLMKRDERRIGWLIVCGAVLMWFLSTSIFASFLVKTWESSIQSIAPSANEPFDYLVVLGGGTSVAPDGRAQFGVAGDRVGYAARLYLAGIAKNLVTTGDTLQLTGSLSGKFSQQDDPSRQTKLIWMALGIPADSISELPGQNTSGEMAALKEHPEYWQGKRCAILTSASHLPRAMQLAERAGIRAMPIAADYRSGSGPLTVNHFLPEANRLEKIQIIFKEWIAMRISR